MVADTERKTFGSSAITWLIVPFPPVSYTHLSLVVAVAKRAREIVANACDSGDIVAEKPVSLAVDEFAKNQYKLVEVDDIGDSIE